MKPTRYSVYLAIVADKGDGHSIIRAIERHRGKVDVALFGNVAPALMGKARRHGWALRVGRPLPDLQHALIHASGMFVFAKDSSQVTPTFLSDIRDVWNGGVLRLGEDTFVCDRAYLEGWEGEFRWTKEGKEKSLVSLPCGIPVELRRATFIVPTHNRPRLLAGCLRHLMSQEIPNGWVVDILVVGTAKDAGRRIASSCERVTYISTKSTIVTEKINAAYPRTNAELIMLADDDDLQPLNRAAEAIKAHTEGASWSASGVCKFYHPDKLGVVRWTGAADRGLVGTTVSVSAKVLSAIGGYPKLKKGKDLALTKRIQKYGRDVSPVSFKDLTSVIGGQLLCLQHGKNIWTRPWMDTGIVTHRGEFEIRGDGPLAKATGISDFTKETIRLLFEGVLDPVSIVETAKVHVDRITGSLATMPGREGLAEVVSRLLPQLDHLNVYLNGFPEVPDFLHHPKITVARSQDHGDRGDAGKFFWADTISGYHLSFDDDVWYPPDVVQRLVDTVNKYGKKVAVACHGAVIAPKVVSYYRSRTLYHCTQAIPQDTPVNVLGTGSTCFHTDAMRVSRDDFPVPNMADVWFGILGQKQRVPFLTIARDKHWIRPMPVGTSIYSSSVAGDKSKRDTSRRQTAKVQEHMPWSVFRVEETPLVVFTVCVFTYNRPEPVKSLLQDLALARGSFDGGVEVRVYDDASTEDYSEVRALCNREGFVYIRAGRNHGKADHWKWQTRAYQDLRGSPSDVYCSLPDDVRLESNFFTQAWEAWKGLKDPRPGSLMLSTVIGREGPCWTRQPIVRAGNGVWKCGWVDGLCLFGMDYLKALHYEVPRTSAPRPGYGSGVGRVISSALLKHQLGMYRLEKPLATNVPRQPSKMNPDIRPSQDLVVKQPPLLPPLSERFLVHGKYTMHGFPEDHISKSLRAGVFYEQGLLQDIAKMGLVGLYVDVGAFIGNHTLWFDKECPSTGVLGVEPQPGAVCLARKTLQANNSNALILLGAVHDEMSYCQVIEAARGNLGMSRIKGGGEVLCHRLDALLADQDVALIKIDTEGCEPSVLRSAAKTIARCRPVIVAEAPTNAQVIAIEKELPRHYKRSKQYNATPTYIWSPR